MTETESLHVRLSASDREALRIEAAAKQTTIAGIARLAISEHLARSTPAPPAPAPGTAAIPLHPGPVWSWPENANVLPDDGPEGGPRRRGRIAAALARLGAGRQRR